MHRPSLRAWSFMLMFCLLTIPLASPKALFSVKPNPGMNIRIQVAEPVNAKTTVTVLASSEVSNQQHEATIVLFYRDGKNEQHHWSGVLANEDSRIFELPIASSTELVLVEATLILSTPASTLTAMETWSVNSGIESRSRISDDSVKTQPGGEHVIQLELF
ncbi:hypothetical protein [Reinekea blandensis]|uniref:Uncharacterized protein n=1 Tax=Reinekea blandensis MED297 TaxID=314283 RepID=A4BA87_9GAMM|nr:hypothetical protein [Reinekea blandensis]EAR10843.1 hypothetical protein MED297_10046 [Reinekea sp. MED297] [Reinekea blandensis MED297]